MQILIYCLNRPFSAGVGFDFNCFFFFPLLLVIGSAIHMTDLSAEF